MNGVQRAEAHGVELYSRDLSTELSGWYVKHAEGAARYFETMFGPLPRKVRMAQVWRDRSMGYARTAYTVLSEGGRSSPHVTAANPGRHVAHEMADAWWMLASTLTTDFWLVAEAPASMSMRYAVTVLVDVDRTKKIGATRSEKRRAGKAWDR